MNLRFDDFIHDHHDGEAMNEPYYRYIGDTYEIHVDPVEFKALSALEVSLFDHQHNLVYSKQTQMKRWTTFNKAFQEALGIAREFISQYEADKQTGLYQPAGQNPTYPGHGQ